MVDKSELDDEILKEIASVGGGYGEKLERCMREMKRIREAILYLRGRIERSKGIPVLSMRLSIRLRRRFLGLKEEAYRLRFYLIVYREALGLLKHKEVYEIYDIESLEL